MISRLRTLLSFTSLFLIISFIFTSLLLVTPVQALTATKPVLVALPCKVKNLNNLSEKDFYVYVNSSVVKKHWDNNGFSVDFGYPSLCENTQALASVSGTVVEVKEDNIAGNNCPIAGTNPYKNTNVKIIDEKTGVYVHYVHMDINAANTAKIGQHVNVGDVIGTISDKGCADGVHIHFQLYEPKAKPTDQDVVIKYADFKFVSAGELAHAAPQLTVTQPNTRQTVDTSATIKWTASDPDSNARVDFYWQSTRTASKGKAISSCANFKEDSPTRQCTFSTKLFPDGEYFVYGCIDDNDASNGPKNCVLAKGSLLIKHLVRRDTGRTWVSSTFDAVQNFSTAFSAAPVVYAQIVSNNEDQPAYIQVHDVTKLGFELHLTERSFKEANDQIHGAELVQWYAVERTNAEEQVNLETLVSPTNWNKITFVKPMATVPVVFAASQGSANTYPLLVTVRNVTTKGFEFNLTDPEGSSVKRTEKVGWIAKMKPKVGRIGTFPSLRTRDSLSLPVWTVRTFTTPFARTPQLFAQRISWNDSQPASTTLQNLDPLGFALRLREGTPQYDDDHFAEKINVFALPYDQTLYVQTPIPNQASGAQEITLPFNQAVNQASVNAQTVNVLASGGDSLFNNGNETAIPIKSITWTNAQTAVLHVDALAVDTYRLTLAGGRDQQDERNTMTNALYLAGVGSGKVMAPGATVIAIKHDLQAITSQKPELLAINNPLPWRAGYLWVELTPAAMQQFTAGNYHGLDALNQKYGPVTVTASGGNKLSLRFAYQDYMLDQLGTEYAAASGVVQAGPSVIRNTANCGQTVSDIVRLDATHYQFNQGEVCNPHLWVFTMSNGNVAKVEESGPALPDSLYTLSQVRNTKGQALDGETVINQISSGNGLSGGNYQQDFIVIP